MEIRLEDYCRRLLAEITTTIPYTLDPVPVWPDLCIPKIIIVGDRKMGKSSLMKRLVAGIEDLFSPDSLGDLTGCVQIQLNLRTNWKTSTTLSIVDNNTGEQEFTSFNFRESIDYLRNNERGERLVLDNKRLVYTLRSMIDLDIIEMTAVTRRPQVFKIPPELVKLIAENSQNAYFICVNHLGDSVRSSAVWNFFEVGYGEQRQNKLNGIHVLTKCDSNLTRMQTSEIYSDIHKSMFDSPKFICTCEKLGVDERDFFNDEIERTGRFSDVLFLGGKLTVNDLMYEIGKFYENRIRKVWVPFQIDLLKQSILQLTSDSAKIRIRDNIAILNRYLDPHPVPSSIIASRKMTRRLKSAAENGNCEAMKDEVNRGRCHVNSITECSMTDFKLTEATALHIAANEGKKAAVVLLLEMGADPTQTCNGSFISERKMTTAELEEYECIMCQRQFEYGYNEVVAAFNGMTIGTTVETCITAGQLAERRLHTEIASILKDVEDPTSLHSAFEEKELDRIISLIERGKELTTKDSNNRSAIDCCPPEFFDEFVSTEFSEGALKRYDFALWFYLLQVPEEIFSMESQIKHLISKYPYLAEVQDASGRLALDVATPVNKSVILSVSTEFSEGALKCRYFALWFYLLQVPEEIFSTASLLKHLISKYPDLAEVQDASGRLALDAATPVNKSVILSVSTEFSEGALKNRDFALWFYLIRIPKEIFPIEAQLKRLASKYPDLVNASLHFAFEKKQHDIILSLLENGGDLTCKDSHGRAAIDCCPPEFFSDFLSIPFSEKALNQNNYALWFHIIQIPDETPCLVELLKRIVKTFPRLVEARDVLKRHALHVATPSNRRVINSVLLIHGRYRFRSQQAMHQSQTCVVFEGLDEGNFSEDGSPLPPEPVALKFMAVRSQYLREINSRVYDFDPEHVINIIRCHPHVTTAMTEDEVKHILDSLPESGELQSDKMRSGLRKEDAEKLYLLVMPLQERNLYVAIKQERFAGRDFEMVKHVTKNIIISLKHMHEKGRVVHADVKPLNIMRKDGIWGMIDLDAAAKIGEDFVGLKSSSAYVPPEGVYVNADKTVATVRSPKSLKDYWGDCELLVASESFDVWSVGCIFYQLANAKVVPLWQCDHDDNLSNEPTHPDSSIDSLFDLFDFTEALKARKLTLIDDPLARNLAAQMLTKDPSKRPTFSRVLAHPYLSGNTVVRMVGERPKNDFFLSYRVSSDTLHVRLLYEYLTARGYTVWWDVMCLESGKNWEKGFCEGLMNSRAFVCIISKEAINHPDIQWQNFGKLAEDSKCDNVFLEHRLALELKQLGLLDFIYPVFIGNPKGTCTADPLSPAPEYEAWDWKNLPNAPDTHVQQVEEKLIHHMESMALGMPLETNKTVKDVLSGITANQGFFLQGEGVQAFEQAANKIIDMLEPKVEVQESEANVDKDEISSLKAEIELVKSESVLKDAIIAQRNIDIAQRDAEIASINTLKDAEIVRLRAMIAPGTSTGDIAPPSGSIDTATVEREFYYNVMRAWNEHLG